MVANHEKKRFPIMKKTKTAVIL